MNHKVSLVILAVMLVTATAAPARDDLRDFRGGGTVLHGGTSGTSAASRDTVYLLGGPGRLDGRFQDAGGAPDWHGWTHVDPTYDPIQRWNVSGFRVPDGGGDLAIWCGQESFPNACGSGYGNSWNEWLVFTHTVADPSVNTVVNLECMYNFDTEEGYDYFKIQQNRGGTWEDIVSETGLGSGTFDQDITYTPSDYVGPAANQVEVRFQGFSDSGWSDEDCLYDTNGLAQVDNIGVTVDGEVFADDFEDGECHHWAQVFRPGVGDFSHIWTGLQDIDPCASNDSPQVAFIDDGVVVPGTGGTSCVTWCYGPGGYVLNVTGGLAGPEHHLDNLVISPVLAWPAAADGGLLSFDAYRHEDLLAGIDEWMLYQWVVRSVATGDPADLAAALWRDNGQVYAGRGYFRHDEVVTGLLEPGCTHVQVALRLFEFSSEWGYNYMDPTPAPYFDNVAVKAFDCQGPAISARDIDLAQDNFPGAGDIDLTNLANNWVRFDMARNISPADHLRNDPGDSIVVDVTVVRAGAVLAGLPRMIVKMRANPLFDGVRQLPANFTQTEDVVDGWVEGTPTTVADRYAFDLPDSNFLFPGDVLHYYIEAQDNQGGDVGTATLPADLAGFGTFSPPDAYPGVYTVRALPTVVNATGVHPWVLFWDDGGNPAAAGLWYDALALQDLGGPAPKFDVFETNGPSSGVGNGLGGRATSDLLEGYSVLLYTCGDHGSYTLSNGDFEGDPSNDLGVLSEWFQQGYKRAFMTGDDLVSSLTNSGQSAMQFVNSYFSTQFLNTDVRPLIGNQTAPKVKPIPGNSVFSTPNEWVVYGGCPVINDFDAVVPMGEAERLAEFLMPSGEPGYPYSAAQRHTNVADVVFLPNDFAFIENPPDYIPGTPGFTVRAEILHDLFYVFGVLIPPPPQAVPGAGVLTVSAWPNPFNPRTTISLDLPADAEVSVRVYDLRGRGVRTLQDGPLPAGPAAFVWQGEDDAGRAMASGVYFYEVKAAGEERIGKLALVR